MREDEEEVYIPPELETEDETETPETEPVPVPTPTPTPTPTPEKSSAVAPQDQVQMSAQAYEPEFEMGNNALFVGKDDEWTAVAPEHVESALSDGYEPAAFYVNPKDINPSTGQPERVVVRKSQFQNAQKDGLIPVFTWHQQQQVEKAKKELPTSQTQALARGAAGMFTYGQTPQIAGAKEAIIKYLQTGDIEAAKRAFGSGRQAYRLEESAAKEQFPLEYGAGEVAGFLGGLGISAPASVASAAGRGALLGGISSAGGGTTYQTPGEEQTPFLERTLMGAGLGAGLGAGGQKLGQVVGKKMAPKLEEIARSRAVKAVQPTISQKFARTVDRLPGGEQALGRDALQAGLIKSGDSVDDILQKALDFKRSSGQKISNVLQELDKSAEGLQAGQASLSKILERVDNEVLAPLASTMAKKDMASKVENVFVKHLRDAAASGESIGFQKLHAERASLDDLAYTPTGMDKVLHKELQKIRKIFEDEIFSGADRVVAKGGPQLKSDYVRAKRAYQVASTVATGAAEKAQKFRANRSISLTDYITGGGIGGTAGTTAGALIAGPGGAAVGGAAGAGTGALLNKWAREKGNPYLANIAQEFAQKFKGDPNAAQKVLKELARIGLIKFPEEE